MEQRASALQQRLEARRNMFLKSDGNQTYGANRPQGKNVQLGLQSENDWNIFLVFVINVVTTLSFFCSQELASLLCLLIIWRISRTAQFLLELKCDDQI